MLKNRRTKLWRLLFLLLLMITLFCGWLIYHYSKKIDELNTRLEVANEQIQLRDSTISAAFAEILYEIDQNIILERSIDSLFHIMELQNANKLSIVPKIDRDRPPVQCSYSLQVSSKGGISDRIPLSNNFMYVELIRDPVDCDPGQIVIITNLKLYSLNSDRSFNVSGPNISFKDLPIEPGEWVVKVENAVLRSKSDGGKYIPLRTIQADTIHLVRD